MVNLADITLHLNDVDFRANVFTDCMVSRIIHLLRPREESQQRLSLNSMVWGLLGLSYFLVSLQQTNHPECQHPS